MKRVRFLFLFLLFLLSCQQIDTLDKDYSVTKPQIFAKNIILFIGDGMGISHITLARLAKGDNLVMDEFPYTGFVKVHSKDNIVPDSAASATAISSGIKVKNFQVGSYKVKFNLVEEFDLEGKAIGIVTTSRITHATVSAFYARLPHRRMEEEACLQLLKEKVDIILGGGKKNFDMDMIRRFKQAGYEIVYTREKLLESESEKLIGLFNKSHINFVLDRKEHEPSLAEMTKKAIEILSKKEKGFFLLVEGARIDMASHNYDAPSCIYEMLEFDEAIHYAFDFARNRDDTLIIITSDHATCGLTITEEANKKLENYRLVKVSAEKMEWLVSERNLKFRDVLRDYAGVRGLGERLVEFFKDEKDKHNRICIIGDIVSKNCGITFIPIDYKFRRLNFDGKTYGHEAEMVPVYAYGKNAKIFSGTLDNVEIFSRILKASGIR